MAGDVSRLDNISVKKRRTTMLRKLMLTLATAATLGAAVLAPNAASAAPWGHGHGWYGHGWHGHGWYGFRPYIGPVYSSCAVRRWVPTPWGPRLRWVNVCY
jgi:hypothetical protein